LCLEMTMRLLFAGMIAFAGAANVAYVPQPAAVKAYNLRVRRARADYYKELTAARRELLSDLKSQQRRLAKSGNVDGAIKLREIAQSAQRQVLTPDDLVRQLHGAVYVRHLGGTYHFRSQSGRVAVRHSSIKKWTPLSVVDWRTLRAPGGGVWVFTPDLSAYMMVPKTKTEAIRHGRRRR